MVVFSLVGIGLVFAYAVFRSGAGLREDWYFCGALLGIVSLVYGLLTPRRKAAPAPARALWLPLAALLGFCCLQLIPLPISVVQAVSAPRLALQAALFPITGAEKFVPLSVAPAATFRYLVVLTGCTVAFFLARNIAWRSRRRPFRVMAPFVGVAFLEAFLGLLQRYWAGNPLAQGTYVNRNHFAGLLEMALPFAVMGAVAAWRRGDADEEPGIGQTLKACSLLVAATVFLAAIIHSLSRMGFLAALAALLIAGLLWFSGSSRSKYARPLCGGVGVLVLVGFLFLPTAPLLHRFADLASTEGISANTRIEIWQATGQLIATYPWFGVGLGGYESSFIAFNTVAPLNLVDFAHNDYLQYFAELGVIGFALLAFLAARSVLQAFRAGSVAEDIDDRCFGIAAAASLAAIGLHSLVDFNLYVPAHMMMVSWIAGSADAVESRSRARRTRVLEESESAQAPAETAAEEAPVGVDFAARIRCAGA